jgi:steroid 5-alpha reductase family enzyme
MLHSLFALMIFQALVLVVSVMAMIWALSLKMKNAGIVDIAWAGLFLFVAGLYAAVGDGYSDRKILFAGMVAVWSARLAIYLYLRVIGHHPKEDARYAKMRENWGARAEGRFFYFFKLQGVMIVLLSVPFALICMNSEPKLSLLELLASALWLIALTGESFSDRQLDHFKHRHPGKTCNVGFWKYSRHPNYFFEWLTWCSYFLFALASPYGWISIFCPILMYYVLTQVTGIPLAEEQSLKSRGDEYRNYQKKTSAFFPWFPKNDSSFS